MIEPVKQGVELISEIAGARPAPGSLCVWWLGQSGFVIKSRMGLLAIDLYLSEYLTRKYEGTNRPHVRMTRSPLSGHDLAGVDFVLASHKHSDHLDPGTMPELLAASPAAVLVLPEAIRVRAIPAAHEELETDQWGRHLYLGYIVESEGLRLYHSGDGLAYAGLAAQLAAEHFDVLFLPINGRDPARGVPGNMTAAEAVDLAARVRPRFVVPHHYDMFTFNTVRVEEFEAQANRLPSGVVPKIMKCAERWEITP
jgi:L-ascorbate 6-phosphate lactonase